MLLIVNINNSIMNKQKRMILCKFFAPKPISANIKKHAYGF